MQKERYLPKTIAIISFILTFTMLTAAIVSDIAIFGEFIFNFVVACVLSPYIFLASILIWLISCVLVFGIYITEEYGFWPLDWTMEAFKEIVGDAQITQQQIDLFRNLRVVILAVCLVSFILSIVALKMHKKAKIEGFERQRMKGFAIPSLIFSLFGILMGIGILFIISII